MTRLTHSALLGLLLIAMLALSAQSQTPKTQPKSAPPGALPFRVVAETRLLMEALTLPNFDGLETLLKEKPSDAETWGFARGQALLIAETANLLLLRPPRNEGRDVWITRAVELRTAATTLARDASNRDYPSSQASLRSLANACNRCHQSFQVDFRAGAAGRPAPKAPKAAPKTPAKRKIAL